MLDSGALGICPLCPLCPADNPSLVVVVVVLSVAVVTLDRNTCTKIQKPHIHAAVLL